MGAGRRCPCPDVDIQADHAPYSQTGHAEANARQTESFAIALPFSPTESGALQTHSTIFKRWYTGMGLEIDEMPVAA